MIKISSLKTIYLKSSQQILNINKNTKRTTFNFLTLKKISFKFFRTSFSKNNKEIIIHPEFENKIYENAKIFNEYNPNTYEDTDDQLEFIKLDKNGIPYIKKNYYEALGLKENSSNKEIRKRFLSIAKKYHPDKNPNALVNLF